MLIFSFSATAESPWGVDRELLQDHQGLAQEQIPADPFLLFLCDQIIDFHQQVISPTDGPRSHFVPSSSEYMRLAMHGHGVAMGFFYGCDRLLRENGDPWCYRALWCNGLLVLTDPIPP